MAPHVGRAVRRMGHRFGERLKELRQERGWLQRDVERDLSLRPGVVSQYERGLREPGFDLLLSLADLFDVTTDFLLGRAGASRPSAGLVRAQQRLLHLLQSQPDLPSLAAATRRGLILKAASQADAGRFAPGPLAERLGIRPEELQRFQQGAPLPPGKLLLLSLSFAISVTLLESESPPVL